MLGDCQGQQLGGAGEGEEDSTVYLRALFKHMVRGGQTQESEQTEVRTSSVCSCRAEFAGDLTGLVLLSDGKEKKEMMGEHAEN